MTLGHVLMMILVVAAVTLVTRWLPFWVFGGRKVPDWVTRLGRTLPPAIMGALVIYCLKGVPFGGLGEGAAAVGCAILVAAVQWFGKNTFISIAAGTALYMALIRML